MARGERTVKVGDVSCILREPKPTRFFTLEPLLARALGPGIAKLLTDGVELDVEGDDGKPAKRKVTAIDLMDSREREDGISKAMQDGVAGAAVRAIAESLASVDPEDLDALCMGLLQGCRVGAGDVPEDDQHAARLYLDDQAMTKVSGRGLTYLVCLQVWYWFVPTSAGAGIGAATSAG